jgi:hypothetical protein
MPMQSVGLGAALLLNERTFIGFYGMSLQDQSPLSLREGDVFTPRDDVSFSHMGMWVGYIHQPQNRLHLVMSSQIGTGGLSHESGETLTTEQVFLINPQVGVEVRLTNWLSFNAGVGYRWVSHPEEAIFRDIDFGRVSTHLQLRLGGFQ